MTDIAQLLGKDADNLLQHRCMTIPSDQLYLPGHDYVDRVMIDNNRPPAVLRNMQTLYNTGRLAGTGYLSILPVDQGVEHSAGASFAANPLYFDPKIGVRYTQGFNPVFQHAVQICDSVRTCHRDYMCAYVLHK